MAESGAGGTSQNTNEADRSYVDELTDRFESRFGKWREEHHAPQTKEEYEETLQISQTGTCATLGAQHYEMEEGQPLWKVRGVDSHVFEQKWLFPDDSSGRLCFHATFKACYENQNDDRYFFTEVTGIKGPQVVRSCVRLSKTRKYSVEICRFCTGLWHPLEVDFLGRK